MSDPPPEHRRFARPGSVPGPPPEPEPFTLPPVVVTAAGAEVVEQGTDRAGPGGRRRWVAGAVALALVGGGAAAYQLLAREPAVTTLEGLVLPVAVTAEPSVAWTRSVDGSVDVTASGDRVFVADEEGEVLALDQDGEELWTQDEEQVSYVYDMPGRDGLLLAGGGADGGGVGALAADDGEVVWWRDDITSPVWFGGDGGLFSLDDLGSLGGEVVWLDTRNGRERWRADAWSVGARGDAVYVVTDDELRRLDRDSGEEQWRTGVTVDRESYPYVAAVDGFVAIGSGAGAAAYDAETGDELWTVEAAEDSLVAVGAFADDRVHVAETTYIGEDDPESTVTVRDADGPVAELDVDTGPFLFGTPLVVDGRAWFLDHGSGRLFDEDAELVAQYDGDVTLLDRGLYTLAGTSLAYHRYGDEDPAWELELPGADDEEGRPRIEPFDAGLVVVGDGELTAYR